VQRRINALGVGQKMQDLPEELWHESFRYYVKEDPTRVGGPNLRIIRLDPNKQSLTVTGYIFNKFVHPYEDRFITPREAARLQGFPDDLEFKGTLTSVQRQVGDAVPLELGRAIFRSLLNTLDQYCPKQNVYQTLSLFSGAGGLDIALEQVSRENGNRLNTFASVEIDEDRCETLKGYFQNGLSVFQKDLSEINAQSILSACNMRAEDVSVVYGGPPCQPFSQAGKQKGIQDSRGKLILDFLRYVNEINPPFFMMENVSNLKGIDKGRLLEKILINIADIGYYVNYAPLRAVDYGSPQKRSRLIFIGSRKDLPMQARLPEPTHGRKGTLLNLLPYKTVRDAFKGLPTPNYEPIRIDE
jgi:DNA (cytosine-5)-methyltransferase 1